MLLPYCQSNTFDWLFPIPTPFSASNNAIFQVTKLLFQSMYSVLERALEILVIKKNSDTLKQQQPPI
jgi:hypothetical protein